MLCIQFDLYLNPLNGKRWQLYFLWAEAGMSSRQPTYFLSLRRKKVGKERAALLSVTPAPQALGQPVMLGRGACCGTRLRAQGRSAQTTAASQTTKHARSDAHAAPRPV
ncbi:hypothetical protein, partial [Comamonas humi]